MSDPAPEQPTWLHRLRSHRVGLRSRILATFTLGVAALAVVLAFTTYGLTRSTLLRQREDTALRQAYSDARGVRAILRSNPTSAKAALDGVSDVGPAEPLLRYRDEWANTSPKFTPDSLPAGLERRVIDEQTAAQMLYSDGQPLMAVGIPLPDVGATFFEVVPLDELSRTLGSVRVSLLGAVAITTALGVLLGALAARRAVQPLADAAQAAQAIAGGGLGTRLEPGDDPDLQVLAGSFNDMASALQQQRRARRPVRVRRQPRAPVAPDHARRLGRGAQQPPRRATRQGGRGGRPDRGRRGPLPEPGRGPAGDLPLRRRRRAPGTGRTSWVAEFVRQAVSVSTLPEAHLGGRPEGRGLWSSRPTSAAWPRVANLLENARYYPEVRSR